MSLNLQNNDPLLTESSAEIWLEQDRYLSAALNSQPATTSASAGHVHTISGNLQVSSVHLLDLSILTLDDLNTLTLAELESLNITHATAFVYDLLTQNFNLDPATISGIFINTNKIYSYELLYNVGLVSILEFSSGLEYILEFDTPLVELLEFAPIEYSLAFRS